MLTRLPEEEQMHRIQKGIWISAFVVVASANIFGTFAPFSKANYTPAGSDVVAVYEPSSKIGAPTVPVYARPNGIGGEFRKTDTFVNVFIGTNYRIDEITRYPRITVSVLVIAMCLSLLLRKRRGTNRGR